MPEPTRAVNDPPLIYDPETPPPDDPTYLKLDYKTGKLAWGPNASGIWPDWTFAVPLTSFARGHVVFGETRTHHLTAFTSAEPLESRPDDAKAVTALDLYCVHEPGFILRFAPTGQNSQEAIRRLLDRTLEHLETDEGREGYIHPVVALRPERKTYGHGDVWFLDFTLTGWLHADGERLLEQPAAPAAAAANGGTQPSGPSGPIWEAAKIEENWAAIRIVPEPGGKSRKLALDPETNRAVGHEQAAWLTFAETTLVISALNAELRAKRHVYGYMPRPGSALICGDIDGSADAPVLGRDGKLAPSFAWLAGSYIERSPSGHGARVLLARTAATPAVNQERNGIGLYAAAGKALTVTLEGQGEIAEAWPLQQRLLEMSKRPEAAPAAAPRQDSGWWARLSLERQLEEVGRMLGYLTADEFGLDYELWRNISCAVKSATDGEGEDLWDTWCAGLPGYDAEQNQAMWQSFDPDKVTVGTLIMYARQHGYEPPPDAFEPSIDPELAGRIAALGAAAREREDAPEQGAPSSWCDGMSTAHLMNATFRPARWAVEGLLPEGFVVFAARQKAGKTWLALLLGHAVGMGGEFLGRLCYGGDVLMILLEDNPRRVRNRLEKMQLGDGCTRVHVYNSWPGPGPQAVNALVDWLEQALKGDRKPRLVIIDTLRRFIGSSAGRADAYQQDVQQFAPLQRVAMAAEITILGIHHERKDNRSTDWQDRFSGSLGLLSVADTLMSLARERGKASALLRVTGRDVEDLEQPLMFQSERCTWTTLDRHPAVQEALLRSRQGGKRLLEVMIEDGEPRTAAYWAARVGTKRQSADEMLRRLEQDGAVERTALEDGANLWVYRKPTQ